MSYITIYFGEKPVFLCDELTTEIEEFRHHPDTIYIDELSGSAIQSLLHEITKSSFHAGIIINKDFEKLKKLFFRYFKIIKAGGGLVKNNEDAILLIFRRGKWDLPKGKLDKGETIEECAVREVKEETGLTKVKLGKPLMITYHTYVEFGKHILKESHWYLMYSLHNETLVPQTEEDITEIRWVQKEDLKNYLDKIFPAIGPLIKNAF